VKAILSKPLFFLFLLSAAFLTASAAVSYHAVRVLNDNQGWVSASSLRGLAVTFAVVGMVSVGLLAAIALSVRREITERADAARQLRASEGRLLLAIEAAEIGVWEHDPITGEVTATDRCRAMFGLPPGEPVTGETMLSRIEPADQEHLRAVIRKAIEPGGRGEFVIEYRVLWPDGTVRTIRSRGRALFEGTGETRRPLRLVGTLLDLTDMYQVETDLREARDRAEAASRTKDQFLAVLSHELRTPLTPVLAAVSDLEQRRDLPPGLRGDIATIRRNVEMEARLIDDLLDLTRIARGKVKLHPEVVDVHALVPAVIDMFRAEVADKGMRLTTDLAAARHHVWGDSGRLQQVLWNLLSNSLKFTPAGGLVTVRTANADDDGRILIEVTDTGIGLEAASIPRLFNAFEQGEQTIARKYGGLGLGLSIAKAIMDLHEGTLEAQSAGRDKGTTFVMRLKTAPNPKPGGDPSPPAAVPEPRRDGAGRLRILLVEDNEDTRRLMGRLLRTFGHHVEAADSIAAALDLAGRERFDLLVSDIGLPDGTGWDLMGRLGDRRPPKAIALSGFGMEDDLRRSRDAGFLEHVIKPVNIIELRAMIERVAATGVVAPD
jgi:signal transduction histidine kinase